MESSTFVRVGRRDRVRGSMEPFARVLGRVGLTPNALTLIGFGIAVIAAWAAANELWLMAGLLVIFGALFDLFDGALARATNQATKLGAFLDSTFDRWGEAVIFVGLIVGLQEVGLVIGPQIAAAAMASAFMVSYTRAKAESLGYTPGRGMANVGLAPREIRIVILALGLVLAGLLQPPPPTGGAGGGAIQLWYWILVGSLALIALLATVTTVQRIVHVYREARQQENQ